MISFIRIFKIGSPLLMIMAAMACSLVSCDKQEVKYVEVVDTIKSQYVIDTSNIQASKTVVSIIDVPGKEYWESEDTLYLVANKPQDKCAFTFVSVFPEIAEVDDLGRVIVSGPVPDNNTAMIQILLNGKLASTVSRPVYFKGNRISLDGSDAIISATLEENAVGNPYIEIRGSYNGTSVYADISLIRHAGNGYSIGYSSLIWGSKRYEIDEDSDKSMLQLVGNKFILNLEGQTSGFNPSLMKKVVISCIGFTPDVY